MRLRLTAFLIVSLIASTALADEVRLANGDRFTGEVVALAGGTLSFKTAYGSVQIPWNDVDALGVTGPILVTVGTAAPAFVTTIPTACSSFTTTTATSG